MTTNGTTTQAPGLLRHYDIVVVFKCIILFDSVIEQRGQKRSVRLAKNTTSVMKEEKKRQDCTGSVSHRASEVGVHCVTL